VNLAFIYLYGQKGTQVNPTDLEDFKRIMGKFLQPQHCSEKEKIEIVPLQWEKGKYDLNHDYLVANTALKVCGSIIAQKEEIKIEKVR
jgi:hypothetical protein